MSIQRRVEVFRYRDGLAVQIPDELEGDFTPGEALMHLDGNHLVIEPVDKMTLSSCSRLSKR